MDFSKLFHDAVLASWVQAAIYLVTLGVLIFQSRVLTRQTRSQEEALKLQTKALQQSDYLRCQIDFTESMRAMLASGLYAKVYDSLARAGSRFEHWKEYDADQKATYSYLEIIYELFERIFVQYQEGWIESSEWLLWQTWFMDVVHHPLFKDVLEDNVGMYDKRFENYVRNTLQGAATAPTTSGGSTMQKAPA